MSCTCGLPAPYQNCCGIFHEGKALPATAEELMRSRYSAFVKREISYLRETNWPPRQKLFDEAGYASRAANSLWLGLNIVETFDGKELDTKGTVTFIAKSMINSILDEQREKSLFRKKDGRWYYVKPFKNG